MSIHGLSLDDPQVSLARREFEKAARNASLHRASGKIFFAHMDDKSAPLIEHDTKNEGNCISFYRNAYLKKFKLRYDDRYRPINKEGTISIIDFKDGVLSSIPIYYTNVKIPELRRIFKILQFPDHLTITNRIKSSGVSFDDLNDVLNEKITAIYPNRYSHASRNSAHPFPYYESMI